MKDFNSIRNAGVCGSFTAVVTGIALLCTPNSLAKTVSPILLFGGVGSLVATFSLVDASEKIGELSKKALEEILKTKESELSAVTEDAQNLAKTLNDLMSLEAKHKDERRLMLEDFKSHTDKMQIQLEYFKNEVNKQGKELTGMNDFCANNAANLLDESLEHFRSSINGILILLTRKYPALTDELLESRQKYDAFIAEYEPQVEVVRSCRNVLQIIEGSIAVHHQIMFRGSLLKIGIYKRVEKFLRTILGDSITIDKHNQIVDEIEAEFAERKARLQQHYNDNYQSILAEYQNEVDGKCEKFQAELAEICNQGMADAERIEKLETAITETFQELNKALQSHKFPGNTEQARVGNAISTHYSKLGYILDALEWKSNETGYTLFFHISRNGNKFISADMLNDGDNPEKLKELTNAINLPKFEINYRGGNVSLDVQKTDAVKKEKTDELSDESVNRLARSWDTWKKQAKKWNRIRITGGSGAGKSPLTERIVSEQLRHKKIKGLDAIKLYNPQAGSRKDNWSFPSVGKTHADSIRGVSELTNLCGRKFQGDFAVWIFDEVDSSLRQAPGKKRPTVEEPEPEPTMAANMLSIITQIDHTSQAVFYLGQGANTGKIPNTTKGDWNNLVAIHILGNSKEYLRLAEHIDSDSKDKLMKQSDLLQRYCDRKNSDLGLDRVEPGAYRYALVDEYGEKQYFVLLPLFSADEFLDSLISEPSTTVENPTTAENPITVESINCPTCRNTELTKNGKHGLKQKYLCKSCGERFKI